MIDELMLLNMPEENIKRNIDVQVLHYDHVLECLQGYHDLYRIEQIHVVL
jgi:hypothetical protein